jgi:hypothetical protein
VIIRRVARPATIRLVLRRLTSPHLNPPYAMWVVSIACAMGLSLSTEIPRKIERKYGRLRLADARAQDLRCAGQYTLAQIYVPLCVSANERDD